MKKISKVWSILLSSTLSALFALCGFFGIISLSASASDTETAEELYEISTAEELLGFAEKVNGGNTAISGKLTANIDLSEVCYPADPETGTVGKSWPTIGNSTSRKYVGTFDGQGYRIENLYVNSTAQGVGLFGVVGGGAYIKNVGVSGSVYTTNKYAGGIVGQSTGSGSVTIENCSNEANVRAGGVNAAGIIGCNDGSGASFEIKNCFNSGKVIGSKESAAISAWLGNNALVSKCYNVGEVEGIQEGCSFARMSSATFLDCGQLKTVGEQNGIATLTTEDFRSGEFTFKLGEYWGQNIDGAEPLDPFPVFGGAKIYADYGTDCAVDRYTNEVLLTDRPAHTQTYYDKAQCELCKEWHPESVYYSGLDLTLATANLSGGGYAWDHAQKTLTLDGFSILTSAEIGLKFPANSKIIVADGSENSLVCLNGLSMGVVCDGSLTIEGGGKFDISTAGGNAIYLVNDQTDIALTVTDAEFSATGGNTYIKSKNSSVKIENSIVKTHPSNITLVSEQNGASAFEVSGSDLNSGLVKVENTGASRTTTDKLTFKIENSTVYIQGSGDTVNMITLTANEMDIDFINCDITLWNSGWAVNHNHAYGARFNGKGTSYINIEDTNLQLYGYHSPIWSDALDKVDGTSYIKNCSILGFAKGALGDMVFMENDSEGNGYGNDDVTSRLMKNNVVFICSNMGTEGSQQVTATVQGSPVLSQDFEFPVGLGSVSDLSQYMEINELRLKEGQSITLTNGAKMTMPENVPIVLEAGASVSGGFNCDIQAADGVEIATYNYGGEIQMVAFDVKEGVDAFVDVEPTQTAAQGYKVLDWYNDASFTEAHTFNGGALATSQTIYAKLGTELVYYANYSGGSDQTIEVEKGVEVTISSLTREGYQFTGWNTKADGSGDAYAAGETRSLSGEKVELYAQWVKTTDVYNIPEILPSAYYTGSKITQSKIITYKNGDNATADITYKKYSNNVQIGELTASVEFKIGNDPTIYVAKYSIYSREIVLPDGEIEFESKSVVYNGSAQGLIVTGSLPSEVTVSYAYTLNGLPIDAADVVNVGAYEVVATLSQQYYEDKVLRATLVITKATYDMSGVSFADLTALETGKPIELSVSGELPKGVSVRYENNGQTEPGEYEVTAIFSGDYANYNEIPNQTAKLVVKRAKLVDFVQIGEETITLTVRAKEGFPLDMSVEFTRNEAGNYIKEVVFGQRILAVYKVELKKNGERVEYDGELTYELSVPSALAGKEFFILNDDGSEVSKVNYTVVEDKIVVEGALLKDFLVVYEFETKVFAISAIVIALILLIGLIVIIL